MDRRPLVLLLALGLVAAVPAGAAGASVDDLLAGTPSGTLSDTPSGSGLTAQASTGTLSDKPTAAKGGGGVAKGSPATADALPFTGSDPRITLLLGVAALLAGAGLRLRTGDARDY